MRLPRLFALAASAVAALALSAVAAAVRGPSEDGTLSVRDGRGIVVMKMKGGVIGRFAKGRLTVTDSLENSEIEIVRGAERVRVLNDLTTIYQGTNIRFRIADERRISVRVEGNKINLSAVGRGEVLIDGRGNLEDGVFFDGSYSLNGGAYKSLPDFRERFELAATPPGE